MQPFSYRVYPINELPKKRRNRAVLSCVQCHQSKIKCDRKLPCKTCVISGRAQRCTFRGSGTYNDPRSKNASADGVKTTQTFAVENTGTLLTLLKERETSRAVHNHKIMGGTISLSQANAAALGQFVNRFTSSRKQRSFVELIAAESERRSTPQVLITALQAAVTAVWGNDTHDPEIQQRGLKLYGASIRQVQAYISSDRVKDPVIIYATILLALYEAIVFSDISDGRSIRAHIRGVAHLFQMQGPRRLIDGLEHDVFRRYRLNILLMNMVDREPSFLAEDQWKIIPFSRGYPSKDIAELLQDILVEIPGVLAVVDTITNSQSSVFSRLRKAFELAQYVWRLTNDLENWKRDWIITYPSVFMHLKTQYPTLATLNEICSRTEPYDDLLEESLNCFCAAHLLLARISHGISKKSLVMGFTLRPPYQMQELIDAIISISTRQLRSNGLSMSSIHVISFALRVALTAIETDQPSCLYTVQSLIEELNTAFKRRFSIMFTQSVTINSLLKQPYSSN